jgi:hypothetical protein
VKRLVATNCAMALIKHRQRVRSVRGPGSDRPAKPAVPRESHQAVMNRKIIASSTTRCLINGMDGPARQYHSWSRWVRFPGSAPGGSSAETPCPPTLS